MAHETLITIGMKCPKPLFETSKRMKALVAEEVLEIEADDPAFKPDIEAWCRRTGNPLLEIRIEGTRTIARVKKAA
jgi:tRNA 2-thiouridine synthesizing protein A